MKTLRFLGVALALVAVTGVASAQFDVNGPNANLTAQGLVPSASDALTHDVAVTLPGILLLQVDTGANANAGLALLASTEDPTGPTILTPYGGSVDIGLAQPAPALPTNIQILGDGLNPAPGSINDLFYASDDGNAALGINPTFTFAYNVSTVLDGQQVAFQAIVADPANPPFNFDNTEAASCNFVVGTDLIAFLADDGTAEFPFAPGFTFDFHGQQYTSVWLVNNGYANFGAISTVAAGGFTQDYVSFATSEPAIAAHIADWGAQVGGNPVTLQQIGTAVNIIWGDPTEGGAMAHFASSDVGNVYSLAMTLNDGVDPNAGAFTINNDILIDDPTAADYGSGARGHTPGGAALTGSTASTDLNNVSVSLPGDLTLEEHSLDPNLAATLNGWDGLGSARAYNNSTRNWNGRSVAFFPNPAIAVIGDQGYTAIPDGSLQPADVNGFVDAAGAPLAGNPISDAGGLVTVAGSFEQLIGAAGVDPGGVFTIEIDPNNTTGAGNIPCALVGIYDNSGTLPFGPAIPGLSGAGTVHRDKQACDVIVPALVGIAGATDMIFRFSDGTNITIPIFVNAAGTASQTFTIGDDASQAVTLTANTINFYGTAYNSFFIGSNGQVSFVQGSADFTDTLAEGFAGFQIAPTVTPNPGFSPLWTDLNQNGVASGATYDVLEDTVNNITEIQFNNQNEWGGGGTPIGSWKVVHDAPNFTTTYDYSGMIPATLAGEWTFIYTNGNDALGTSTDLTDGLGTGVASNLGIYTSAAMDDSIGETMPAGTDPTATFPAGVNILDLANNGTLFIF